MKTIWINLLLATTVLLAGCATQHRDNGQNQFYGEVKTGYEASHTNR